MRISTAAYVTIAGQALAMLMSVSTGTATPLTAAYIFAGTVIGAVGVSLLSK